MIKKNMAKYKLGEVILSPYQSNILGDTLWRDCICRVIVKNPNRRNTQYRQNQEKYYKAMCKCHPIQEVTWQHQQAKYTCIAYLHGDVLGEIFKNSPSLKNPKQNPKTISEPASIKSPAKEYVTV